MRSAEVDIMSGPIFRVINVSKRFNGKEALRDVSFEVEKGEIFAIIGPSGAGKSTLLRLLNLLDIPTKGRIFFDGTNVDTAISQLELRRRMAMVFQEIAFFGGSVYDNIAYGLRIRKEDKESIDEKVEYALDLVGLSDYKERDAKTLSGGEAQRIAFARATVLEPDVLLLDEPTANLDPINESIIEDIILRINKLGITVVIATHKQAEAISLADHVAVLNEGKIEQIGTPSEVFYRPATRFVANFTGAKNIFEGVVKSLDKKANKMTISTKNFDVTTPYKPLKEGTKVDMCIRPEEIMVLREDIPINPRHTNIIQGEIVEKLPYGGAMFRLYVKVGKEDYDLIVDIPRHAAEKMDLKVGKRITVSLMASSCRVISS
jgi:tungstate transport system ATP-binding protein